MTTTTQQLRGFEGIVKSEKAGSRWESNPGHLWLKSQCSALPLSHDSRTTIAYIEDCEGWWLSGCGGSVAEHWELKPCRGVLGSTPQQLPA